MHEQQFLRYERKEGRVARYTKHTFSKNNVKREHFCIEKSRFCQALGELIPTCKESRYATSIADEDHFFVEWPAAYV